MHSTVSVRPRVAAPQRFGDEQLERRDFVADYLQLGPRLLVELREHPSCVSVRHEPVLRVEQIERTSNNFVVWDFVLGGVSGGFAALAFARPKTFSPPLIDSQGRTTHNITGAYVVGGVFSGIAVGLLAAGVVNALRSTNTTRYADAFKLARGPERACADADAGAPVGSRSLRLVIGDRLELEGHSDADGRARFELPDWDGPALAHGRVSAVLELARADGRDFEPRVLVLWLRVPFDPSETHAGVADTRREAGPVESPVESPVEGPRPAEGAPL